MWVLSMPLFIGFLQVLISPSLGDLLYSALRASPYGSPKSGDQIESFVFLHAQKESKQRKRAPYITVDGKKRHRVNSGRHAPRPKGRPTGVQNGYPAVLSSALHK